MGQSDKRNRKKTRALTHQLPSQGPAIAHEGNYRALSELLPP